MKKQKSICIIDDDKRWCRNLENIINHDLENFKVYTFTKKIDAKSFLSKNRCNIIIIDLVLDTSSKKLNYDDGFQISEIATNNHIPIIMISAYPNSQVIKKAYNNYYIKDFIFKSQFSAIKFIDSIENALLSLYLIEAYIDLKPRYVIRLEVYGR